MKSVFTVLLILSHILVNGVAASVHMTEDYEHDHNVVHSHLVSAEKHAINDDWQHEHNDEAHMHLEYQLSETAEFQLARPLVATSPDFFRRVVNTNLSPPVPPPTI